MNKEKRILKISKMNKAYKEINKGISILRELYNNNNDVKYYVWKLEKIYGQLNKKLLKLVKQEQMDEDFEKLVIKLKEDDNVT